MPQWTNVEKVQYKEKWLLNLLYYFSGKRIFKVFKHHQSQDFLYFTKVTRLYDIKVFHFPYIILNFSPFHKDYKKFDYIFYYLTLKCILNHFYLLFTLRLSSQRLVLEPTLVLEITFLFSCCKRRTWKSGFCIHRPPSKFYKLAIYHRDGSFSFDRSIKLEGCLR